MKWATRDHIHLDRVACPWLVRRFIDPKAEFFFVEWGKEDSRPKDAIPFAIPGVELGPHDEHGTCFDKFLRKYKLDDPALAEVAKIVASGIRYNSRRGQGDQYNVPAMEGIGMIALSEGMMLTTLGDADNLDKSMVVYDALYAYCKSHVLVGQDPSLAQKGMRERVGLLRGPIKAALTMK
ncbi:MAG: chromate resistance protein ChrB domain-containing protein [Chloroflexota bacterium]